MRKPKTLLLKIDNLTEKEQLRLLMSLFNYAFEELPANKDLEVYLK